MLADSQPLTDCFSNVARRAVNVLDKKKLYQSQTYRNKNKGMSEANGQSERRLLYIENDERQKAQCASVNTFD